MDNPHLQDTSWLGLGRNHHSFPYTIFFHWSHGIYQNGKSSKDSLKGVLILFQFFHVISLANFVGS
jgi:hypothetical protein